MSDKVRAEAPGASGVPILSDGEGGRATPILAEDEVSRRMRLLARLQAALDQTGVHGVLARNHRLVLRYNDPGCAPSGLTNPALHVLDEAKNVVTTDGACYRLGDGREFPISELAVAAGAIRKLSKR